MGSVNTVSISGKQFSIYGTLDEANTHFVGSVVRRAAWEALDRNTRLGALVEAARLLDRQRWRGEPTDKATPQPLQFPRTGLTDRDGDAIADDVVPDDICVAEYELAYLLGTGSTDVLDNATTGSNVKRVGAGPAQVEFFQPTRDGTPRFPQLVHELVRHLLASSSQLTSVASGTDGSSSFCDLDQHGRNKGFA